MPFGLGSSGVVQGTGPSWSLEVTQAANKKSLILEVC